MWGGRYLSASTAFDEAHSFVFSVCDSSLEEVSGCLRDRRETLKNEEVCT